MKALILTLLVSVAAGSAAAEILVPVRTIRAKEILAPEDFVLKNVNMAGVLSNPADLAGKEARVVLYPGRPVRPGDIGMPALIERNDVVELVFLQGGLRITTEGRSLGRGAAGDSVRVMNLASRTTVFGQVRADGSVEVR